MNPSQVISGGFADPSGIILPPDVRQGAIYYQENVSSPNEWEWQVGSQMWFKKPAVSLSGLLKQDGTTPMLADLDFNGFKGIGLADPTSAQDAATKAYVDGLGAGYVHNPMLSDLNAGNFNITNVGTLTANNGVNANEVLCDVYQSTSGSSFLYLTADANFGILNGEASGADINLVSSNGSLSVSATGQILFLDGANGELGLGTVSPDAAMHIKLDGSLSALGFLDLLLDNQDSSNAATNQARFRLMCQGDIVQGFSLFETSQLGPYGGFAGVWHTENADIAIGTDNTERLRVKSSGLLCVGASSDDGTSSLIQSAVDISAGNSYWAQGSQGGSGFSVLDADGVTTHTVVGGIVMN